MTSNEATSDPQAGVRLRAGLISLVVGTALLGTKMRWAGLSATLPHAVQFFGDLTGTWVDNVSAIAPASADLVSQGAEYHLILRSDPTSQAATLSTSIQTIMLVARMMDRMDSEGATERFGSRTFVFTDDLDGTHRLYDNLLDAEARRLA